MGSEVASGNWGAKSGAQGGDGGGEETVAAGEGTGVASRMPARAQVLQQDAPVFVFWGLTVLEQAEVLSEAWVA